MDALVLSIGATEGDFEVGAVRRLFELGVKPALIAATSVGAINAVKIAEGENRGTTANPSGLAGLETIWLSLNTDTDMYVPNPDFDLAAVVQAVGNTGVDLMTDLAGGVLALFYGPAALPVIAVNDLVNTAPDLGHLATAVNALLNCRSTSLLTPIGTKLAALLDPALVKSSGIRLLLSTVSLEEGKLRFVNELGGVLEADGRTARLEAPPPGTISAVCQPTQDQLESVLMQIGQAIKAHDTVRQDALMATANALRRALDACTSAHPAPSAVPLVVRLADGAMASASIPVMFTPTKLGSQNYVDGGTRAPVPVAAAVAAGASRVFAVVTFRSTDPGQATNPQSGNPITSFDSENVVSIAVRVAQQILPDQIDADNVAPPTGWGATDVVIIQPAITVHDGLSIEPGLIRIGMANGYMRADDANAARQKAGIGYGPGYQFELDIITGNRQAMQIITRRKQIWQREYAANGFIPQDPSGRLVAPVPAPGGPDAVALADVRSLKRQLKGMVDARVAAGGAVPSGPEPLSDWWLDWEHHQFTPVAPLWNQAIAFGLMTVGFSPGGPFADGVPVTITFTAVDQLNPGPDLHADILLEGVKQPGTTGMAVTLTPKKQTHTQVIIVNGKPEKITVRTDPIVQIAKTGFTPVDKTLPVK